MDVIFTKKVLETENKLDIAAKLKASYSGVSASGGVSVSVDYAKEKAEAFSNTTISVTYYGANNDAFIKDLTIEELQ